MAEPRASFAGFSQVTASAGTIVLSIWNREDKHLKIRTKKQLWFSVFGSGEKGNNGEKIGIQAGFLETNEQIPSLLEKTTSSVEAWLLEITGRSYDEPSYDYG